MGGFAVDNATLTRFFSLHFLLPFVIAGITIVHLLFLHQTGRNNPLGINSNFDKISFHPYFSSKDLFGFFTIIPQSTTSSIWTRRRGTSYARASALWVANN